MFLLDGYTWISIQERLCKSDSSKWGNCRAVRIPSEVCAQLGIDAGSDLDAEVVR